MLPKQTGPAPRRSSRERRAPFLPPPLRPQSTLQPPALVRMQAASPHKCWRQQGQLEEPFVVHVRLRFANYRLSLMRLDNPPSLRDSCSARLREPLRHRIAPRRLPAHYAHAQQPRLLPRLQQRPLQRNQRRLPLAVSTCKESLQIELFRRGYGSNPDKKTKCIETSASRTRMRSPPKQRRQTKSFFMITPPPPHIVKRQSPYS